MENQNLDKPIVSFMIVNVATDGVTEYHIELMAVETPEAVTYDAEEAIAREWLVAPIYAGEV